MADDAEQIRIRVPTPEGVYGAETLWAQRMHGTQDEAVILNAPFFLDDPALNYGDLVRVRPEGGSSGFYAVTEILATSGHRRVTVLAGDEHLDAADLHHQLQERFGGLVMEATADPRDGRIPPRLFMLWISVPPDLDVAAIMDTARQWLAEQQAEGENCLVDGPWISAVGPFNGTVDYEGLPSPLYLKLIAEDAPDLISLAERLQRQAEALDLKLAGGWQLSEPICDGYVWLEEGSPRPLLRPSRQKALSAGDTIWLKHHFDDLTSVEALVAALMALAEGARAAATAGRRLGRPVEQGLIEIR
jgi:hypothetical protein